MRRKDEDEGGRVADEESETEDLGPVGDLVSGTLSAGQSQSADFMRDTQRGLLTSFWCSASSTWRRGYWVHHGRCPMVDVIYTSGP